MEDEGGSVDDDAAMPVVDVVGGGSEGRGATPRSILLSAVSHASVVGHEPWFWIRAINIICLYLPSLSRASRRVSQSCRRVILACVV